MTWFALLESNTTGTGRQFAAAARARGLRPVLLARDPARYPYVADDRLDTRVLDTGDADQILATCRGLARDGGLAGVTSSSAKDGRYWRASGESDSAPSSRSSR